MPNELAYWIPFMSDEDREVMYLGISETNNLWYQTWIVHPKLKQYLLQDFRYFPPAAIAIKEIVCHKRINPSKLEIKDFSIAQILAQIYLEMMGGRMEPLVEYFEIGIFVLMSEVEGKKMLA